ncbi:MULTISPECIES: homoserine dehydrogenase [Psychrilyobacter]|uniref:Homoserine dehydrogenase n=1 Tax=Psychrilyobacter piezotolerans TaxID=2293438 RepID=A0ABX9KIG4_9FUSO|nr:MULTISPECIES: homoserine dehydrogenase [Psychrilyobacter]MCS5420659.1 homoserine dehydrogenase [Psychrilyobacter sp. S5]NDI77833.1 homoserine dehydrogenase [Psychrilyobacter piezotolerans]RDE62313.1 homoserine dehydrogenase [Psychrilyobacter sp. S5]REI41411.1 homoserine dehydrogenase [Psychrilyobacter piezotolerans]
MKLGIIGLGTVGINVLKILSGEKDRKNKEIGDIEILKICDLQNIDLSGYDFTDDYREVLNDPRIDTVVELIGGVGAAYEISKSTLNSKKNLVTANKHLLAVHGKELFSLAEKNQVKLQYEASVGGGIPVISPIKENLFVNNFKNIRGILNGTCNYMLMKMEEGLTYSEALEDAKLKGYAEADPTFDIKGIDTAHKISILAHLAWGELKEFSEISIVGIDKLTKDDVEAAKSQGLRYKLLGEANFDGKELNIRVAPVAVKKDELLYNVNGVYNAVELDGNYTGKTIFYGEGAGGDATAAAVISDIYKIKLGG